MWRAAAAVAAVAAVAEAGRSGSLGMGSWRQHHAAPASGSPPKPSTANCTWEFYDQTLDHFTPGAKATYRQRYCLYTNFWAQGAAAGFRDAEAERAPIFFYTGNESPVEEYVNNTGLMWELGEKMGALLVFAEHRYEGESFPEMTGTTDCLSYCTSAQALADYAQLLGYLKSPAKFNTDAPVIAFGGSYGGMLAGWMRIKYPAVIAGAIAASAPVSGFPAIGGKPGLDASSAALSNGVRAVGGAPDRCFDNLRNAWPLIRAVADAPGGRQLLARAAKRCAPSVTADELIAWGQGPWFFMAEGDYPFPSTYITFSVGPGLVPLPAWPMRVACGKGLQKDYGVAQSGDPSAVKFNVSLGKIRVAVDWADAASNAASLSEDDIRASGVLDLVGAVADAAGVWYNLSGNVRCYGDTDGSHPLPQRSAGDPAAAAAAAAAAEAEAEANSDSCPPCEGCEACPLTRRGPAKQCTWKKQPVDNAFAWGPICCNEDLYLANTDVQGVGRDLFWPPNAPKGYTLETVVGPHSLRGGCAGQYDAEGLFGTPRQSDAWATWVTSYYHSANVSQYSNIVWSNGALDPWAGAGVYGPGGSFSGPMVQNVTADGSSVALVIDLGAHHLDLFFATDADPPSAVKVRQLEEEKIREWAQQHYTALRGSTAQ